MGDDAIIVRPATSNGVVETPATDMILEWLAISIVLLLALAFVAAVAVFVLRLLHNLRHKREQELESVWESRIVELIVCCEVDGVPDVTASKLSDYRDEIVGMSRSRQRSLLELIVRHAFVVTGEALHRLCLLAEPAIGAARELTGRRDPAMRALGVHVLGTLALSTHEEEVVRFLDNGVPIVAKTAARTLARSGEARFVRPILATAARLEHWALSEIVSVLQDIGPAARDDLRAVYADPGEPSQGRVICAETLRWLNDLAAADTATRILLTETDRDLLASSLRLLRRVGSAEHAPAIRRMCTSHDPVVRLNALAALATTGDDVDGEDEARMTVALTDPVSWVAIRAARGLREMQRPGPLRDAVALEHPRSALAYDVWPEVFETASPQREAAA